MKFVPVKGYPEWLKFHPESGYYYVDIYRADKTPKRLQRSTKATTPKRAKENGQKIIDKWTGEDSRTGGDLKLSFSHVADELLEKMLDRTKIPLGVEGRIKPSTVVNARIYFEKLKDEFGAFNVAKIDADPDEGDFAKYVNRYRREREQELEKKKRDPKVRVRGKTLYSHWKHMNLVMQYAIEKGYRKEAWQVGNPDPKPGEQRKLKDEEVSAIIAAAKGGNKLQVAWAATMGCRLREILRQQYYWHSRSTCTDEEDFCHTDMESRTMRVCRIHGKTENSARKIKLAPQVYAMLLKRWETRFKPIRLSNGKRLEHLRARNSSPYVFPSPSNPNTHLNQNKTGWRTAKKHAGIKGKAKFHHLRHYFLSEAAKKVKKGETTSEMICKYAGVSRNVFERTYLHLDEHDLQPVSEMVVVKLWEDDSSGCVTH
jgi:integrase